MPALTSNHRNKITQKKVLPLSQQLEMTALSSLLAKGRETVG